MSTDIVDGFPDTTIIAQRGRHLVTATLNVQLTNQRMLQCNHRPLPTVVTDQHDQGEVWEYLDSVFVQERD